MRFVIRYDCGGFLEEVTSFYFVSVVTLNANVDQLNAYPVKKYSHASVNSI